MGAGKRKKDPAAVRLGRKGGKARAKKLVPAERYEQARTASQERWAKARRERTTAEISEAARKAVAARWGRKKSRASKKPG